MDKFSYKARTIEGKKAKGEVEARTIQHAASLVRERGLVVVKLKPLSKGIAIPALSRFTQRVKFIDIVNFSRQMSTMINAGLPLTDALSLLETQVSPGLSKIVSQVVRDVEGGKSFGDALAKHPQAFNTVFVALVKAGEAAGKLDEMLSRLADNLEKEREFRSKTKGALIYPAIVIIGMILVSAVMMIFVIPKIKELFEDFGAELPFATQLLIKISDFVSNYWYVAIIGLVLFSWLFRLWKSTPIGRRSWDALMFRLPIFGNLKKQTSLAEFCRTLGLLVGAGISIVNGLQIVSEIMENVVYKDSIKEAAKRVEKGVPLAAILAHNKNFPSLLSQMLSVGEETGKVDEVLLKLAVYFESESEHLIKGLTTAIEPLIMMVLGVGVGFLVIAIILPIYNLTSEL